MTITKAINHFEWKLNPKNKQWKATKTDADAYNSILKFVKDKHENQFNNNTLFAKLYVIYYGELLKYFDGTVLDKIPQQELHKELHKPFERIVNEFIDKHQNIEYSLQIPKEHRDKHPKQLTKLGLSYKPVEKMDYQETEDNLKSLINLALNQYK